MIIYNIITLEVIKTLFKQGLGLGLQHGYNWTDIRLPVSDSNIELDSAKPEIKLEEPFNSGLNFNTVNISQIFSK